MVNEFDLKDLVETVSDATVRDTDEVSQILKKFFAVTAEMVAKDGRVEYHGFGTFKLVLRKSRHGLLNGQPWSTPDLHEVEFEPAPQFLLIAEQHKAPDTLEIV